MFSFLALLAPSIITIAGLFWPVNRLRKNDGQNKRNIGGASVIVICVLVSTTFLVMEKIESDKTSAFNNLVKSKLSDSTRALIQLTANLQMINDKYDRAITSQKAAAIEKRIEYKEADLRNLHKPYVQQSGFVAEYNSADSTMTFAIAYTNPTAYLLRNLSMRTLIFLPFKGNLLDLYSGGYKPSVLSGSTLGKDAMFYQKEPGIWFPVEPDTLYIHTTLTFQNEYYVTQNPVEEYLFYELRTKKKGVVQAESKKRLVTMENYAINKYH
jgi:hypothetical protein